MIDGNPLFVAVDVCRCLGMSVEAWSATSYLKPLRADERCLVKRKNLSVDLKGADHGSYQSLFPKGNPAPSITLISESGLYKLIMRSDKPIAATFQDTTASN